MQTTKLVTKFITSRGQERFLKLASFRYTQKTSSDFRKFLLVVENTIFAHATTKIQVSLRVRAVLLFITETDLYNFDPLKPHFYIVKLGFIVVYIIFLISARRGGSNEYHNLCFEQKYENYQRFSSENFQLFRGEIFCIFE